jgi:hypothetical protein
MYVLQIIIIIIITFAGRIHLNTDFADVKFVRHNDHHVCNHSLLNSISYRICRYASLQLLVVGITLKPNCRFHAISVCCMSTKKIFQQKLYIFKKSVTINHFITVY